MKSWSKVLGPDDDVFLRRPQWDVVADREGARVVPLRLRVAPTEGAAVSEARLRAEDILAEAEAAAQELLTEARRQGHHDGLAQARTEAEAMAADLLARRKAEAEAIRAEAAAVHQAAQQEAEAMRAAIAAEAAKLRQALEMERTEVLAAARIVAEQLRVAAQAEVQGFQDASRQALVDLALAVAGRILQYELAVRPGLVAALVAAGLEQLKGEDATIRLSTSDLPVLEVRRDDLRRKAGFANLEFIEDGALDAGEFLIRSRHGEVDGRREQTLDAVRQPMLRKLREADTP